MSRCRAFRAILLPTYCIHSPQVTAATRTVQKGGVPTTVVPTHPWSSAQWLGKDTHHRAAKFWDKTSKKFRHWDGDWEYGLLNSQGGDISFGVSNLLISPNYLFVSWMLSWIIKRLHAEPAPTLLTPWDSWLSFTSATSAATGLWGEKKLVLWILLKTGYHEISQKICSF